MDLQEKIAETEYKIQSLITERDILIESLSKEESKLKKLKEKYESEKKYKKRDEKGLNQKELNEKELNEREYTVEQLEWLVKEIHGPNPFLSKTDSKYRIPVLARVYATGDLTWHERSDEEQIAYLKRWLSDQACFYCHKLEHRRPDCPILARKFCGKCKCYGHSKKYCPILNPKLKYDKKYFYSYKYNKN